MAYGGDKVFLLAAPKTPGAFGGNTVLVLSGLTLVAIVLAILIVVWADRFRRRPIEPLCTPEEQLREFEALHERGQLSKQELERIRAKLGSPGKTPPEESPPLAN